MTHWVDRGEPVDVPTVDSVGVGEGKEDLLYEEGVEQHGGDRADAEEGDAITAQS